ncbi:hypothetical protein RB620_12280 [Paenibacillus sp. LHD-117]|uniref:hypothetical protein n=1 Tax=Paenibacillus sp. LHD-117 TaxID=3071412 RepID=UPI0027E1DA5F|nr:hypothetical protein [Paenibacillus sp. LHD-117]MDQ6420214.1 hypothetical protein [Paenibacillus sp. LHD-117]
MFFFFWIAVLIIGTIILYKNRSQDEELLALKLVGYYFLGTFYLAINGLVLPVGFVISLFLRPRENKSVKRGAAIFGLVMMIIGQIVY